MLNLLQEIPPRIILYNLPPIGAGSIHVESLTSYISRISTAHNVTVGVFFTKIIFPYLGKESFPRDGFTPKKSCTFNNFHQSSKELISALTDLTTINNLNHLTLIDFSCFLSNYEVRFNKYWCSCCFQESRDDNLPIYEQLLWVFNVVEICLKHNCKLICSCPSCKTDQYHLARRNIMGYCYKCGSWLGFSKYSYNEDLCSEHLYWQQWEFDLELEKSKDYVETCSSTLVDIKELEDSINANISKLNEGRFDSNLKLIPNVEFSNLIKMINFNISYASIRKQYFDQEKNKYSEVINNLVESKVREPIC
ncbi:hypothetical protein C0R09_21540 [Brevibacillus laterosporus]|uniref:TniQ family protein n=1 Tax=Brevibacillus laterosporus TaxID=1465 RepID=UPI000C771132|nr:TniQ family protein [Brevibacillus laterosporus]AUM66899.1 hypothetical protein C0R09_21540 [Brevibacillus laterosporus]